MIAYRWTPPEINQLLDLFLSSFLAQKRFSAEDLTHYFHQKIVPRIERGDLFLLAYEGDRMIGFAIYEKWEEKIYYLAEMAVAPSYQRKGIGKKLIFSLFEKDPAAKKIVLVTETANPWAHSFYEAIGFTRSLFEHPDYKKGFIGYEYTRK